MFCSRSVTIENTAGQKWMFCLYVIKIIVVQCAPVKHLIKITHKNFISYLRRHAFRIYYEDRPANAVYQNNPYGP